MPSSKTRNALAVVLAAGEGVRMKSSKPKVLHEIAGLSMLAHVLSSLEDAGIGAVAVVLGPGRDDVRAEAAAYCPNARCFTQQERRGTAHAVLAAREAIAQGYDDIVVVFADTPLVRGSSLLGLRAALAQGASVAALGFMRKTPLATAG